MSREQMLLNWYKSLIHKGYLEQLALMEEMEIRSFLKDECQCLELPVLS